MAAEACVLWEQGREGEGGRLQTAACSQPATGACFLCSLILKGPGTALERGRGVHVRQRVRNVPLVHPTLWRESIAALLTFRMLKNALGQARLQRIQPGMGNLCWIRPSACLGHLIVAHYMPYRAHRATRDLRPSATPLYPQISVSMGVGGVEPNPQMRKDNRTGDSCD